MKENGICPKCQSTSVTRIKAFPGTSQSSMLQLTKWGTHFAYFDRYVCTACGFMEHYVNLDHKGWQKWLDKQQKEDSLDSDFV